jgi:hypothetical protein
MLKVFISNTTKDLTEYRDEVIQQLDRMRVGAINTLVPTKLSRPPLRFKSLSAVTSM